MCPKFIASAALVVPICTWTDLDFPPLRQAVSSFGAAVCGGHIYVYGGHLGRAHEYSTKSVSSSFRRVSIDDPATGWEELPSGPGAQGVALVAHSGKLYRIGGMQPKNQPGEKVDNISLATCEVFNPKTRKWSRMRDMPKGRSSHDAVIVGDKLFVVGGWCMNGAGKESDWHDTALCLDLANPNAPWEPIPQPFRRRALSLAVHEEKIYAIGGLLPDGSMELVVSVLDPRTKQWSEGPELPGSPMNGFNPGACNLGRSLFVSPADGKIYRLNEKRDKWEEITHVARARHVHRMVPVRDSYLVVLGGASKSGPVDATETVDVQQVVRAPRVIDAATGKQQTFCPILTSVPIGDDAVEVKFRGVRVKLCCATCVKKWNAEPSAYVNPKYLPQLAGMRMDKRSIEQVFCPVYPDRVVSSKDPFVEHHGRKVYFFNNTAKEKFLADPDKYADSKGLSQPKRDR